MNIDKNEEICSLIDVYSNMLTDKQNDILHDYYFLDLSLSEIAENNGITRQAVKDILDRAVKQCYTFESKLKLHSKLQLELNSLNKILELNNIEKIKDEIKNIINNLEV